MKLNDEEWKKFLSEIDTNKDGEVSRDEFFNFLDKYIKH